MRGTFLGNAVLGIVVLTAAPALETFEGTSSTATVDPAVCAHPRDFPLTGGVF
jgi:hypothetical protein